MQYMIYIYIYIYIYYSHHLKHSEYNKTLCNILL